ncbi:hypothetical protein BUBS_174 [Bacillus phage Bubs]|uniref:Uncharacterized protein n=1 Tax=Bacillus phage Eyuki TaxID=1690431 RepID=A0A0K2FLC8_9CAUD|nr:hypothetical protein QLX47_gp172 [Bacillus phage Eyuki]YP_009279340.1 hypothetical protein BIZ89_gp173 [Bacillus phage Kida]YP_009287049.1 hypothetical protein BI006_gp173 [Bacillus phage Nemo]AOZ61793.1 hypothetical protein BJ4_170 [Bacillus phage BJ4]AOZ62416.1 hypothetical protein SBP8a_166 [Bacillus phage SBP8a]ASR78667.1 hypothetical protein BUBS_174 [Bacillus phage Bubs]ASR78823.1 hypothetical protein AARONPHADGERS_175 [Bacillus phage AaronPhadgers]ASR79363.1 hypothetical protein ZA
MYGHICDECMYKHKDIVDKKISKGVFLLLLPVTPEDCDLWYMHDDEETEEEEC